MEQPFNLVSNTTLKKNVADYTLIVIGAFLQALSYSLFLAPYKIVPGGVYGISIVLHHVTQGLFSFMPEGLPMGATALCFNVAFGHEKTRFGVRAENNCDFCLDIHFYR